MIMPSTHTWTQWEIIKESHKFFLIRWQEIFSDDTYNTWGIKSTNIVRIIKEIENIAEIVERVPQSHKNIKILIDEAKSIKDFVIDRHYPLAKRYIENINSVYIEEFKENGNKSTRRIINVTKVLLESLRDYEVNLKNYIREIIEGSDSKYKIILDSLISSYAVLLFEKGYSLKALQSSTDILTDNSIKEFSARVEKLMESFRGEKIRYECNFIINWAGKNKNLRLKDVEIIQNELIVPSNDIETSFYSQNKDGVIARVLIEANDKFDAYRKAKNKIEVIFGISQIYHTDKESKIRNDLALIKENSGTIDLIGDNEGLFKEPRKAALSNIEELSVLFERLNTADVDRLRSCLQYHKLSLNANSEELTLVNLWIALESLFLGGEETIIKRICKYVPRIHSNNYISKLLIALSISMRKLWKESDISRIERLLDESNKYVLNAKDILKILLADENSDLLKEFIDIVKDNPLLIFRINMLWSNVFGTPQKLEEAIKRHTERVEWQIYRIYRTRNLIMHSGANNEGIRLLIQHLHNYLITIVHLLIYDLKKNINWNIDDALEHRVLLYDHFTDNLKNYSSTKISKEQLYQMDKILNNYSDPAWTAERIEQIQEHKENK